MSTLDVVAAVLLALFLVSQAFRADERQFRDARGYWRSLGRTKEEIDGLEYRLRVARVRILAGLDDQHGPIKR